ncbi:MULTISPECIES: hypothetical protein [unclassified Nocardioides]|jgi:hypothetical protein|uniref:hypothetical protein n=1 Tax=unclassified Nocardioides TaxID=2615069 RepID=UPI000702E466|nr:MULTISPECIES: hypothetical protein [unclassified Nocardioides]KRC52946.1 hypothetical protein ASE19_11110 [Nocardioides sp. Root79]KRC72477.1 hypothetical protein ASE20_07645 [Nocardioides sp. Root240]
MKKTTSPETQTGRHLESVGTNPADAVETDAVARAVARRAALRDRHAQNLTRLMDQRSDLRGVNSLADFVDDAVRWTA